MEQMAIKLSAGFALTFLVWFVVDTILIATLLLIQNPYATVFVYIVALKAILFALTFGIAMVFIR